MTRRRQKKMLFVFARVQTNNVGLPTLPMSDSLQQEGMRVAMDHLRGGFRTTPQINSGSYPLLSSVNGSLHTHFTRCLVFALDGGKSLSLFLEHHLWGDDYAFTVFNEKRETWTYSVSNKGRKRPTECSEELVAVSEEARFCDTILVHCSAPFVVFVFTTPRLSPCHCAYPDHCHDVLIRQSEVSPSSCTKWACSPRISDRSTTRSLPTSPRRATRSGTASRSTSISFRRARWFWTLAAATAST